MPPVLATWMARGSAWCIVFWGAVRLQVPVVALSRDLPDRAVEAKRNAEILAEHRPSLLIVDVDWAQLPVLDRGTRVVLFEQLWARAACTPSGSAALAGHTSFSEASVDAVLCYCYTGGTTKASRCARVTHRMALHEVATYPHIAKLGNEDRVFQQHSLYWGASAFGEVDIALAFGCALVFCEAWDTEGVVAGVRKHMVTCSGLVPSVLAALEPKDVPSLKLVFTWGEALQARVARSWARKVHLLDLLISTECWLSLYADWTAAIDIVKLCPGIEEPVPAFCTVAGTAVRLEPVGDSADTSAADADSGELLVAGPMVSPGYTDPALSRSSFVSRAGRPGTTTTWYCTKDCLRSRGDGFVFAGRADDMVKVGGAWVDIRDVEQAVAVIDGVMEACACQRDLYVVFEGAGKLREGLMHEIRSKIPPDFTLFVVDRRLPRRAGTGKVDRQRLKAIVGIGNIVVQQEESDARACEVELASLMQWCALIVVLFGLVAAAHASRLCTMPVLHAGIGLMGWICGLAICTFELVWRTLVEFLWRALCLVYLSLSFWYLPHCITKWLRNFPCGVHGFQLVVSMVLPSPAWGLCCASVGLVQAGRRQRLLSWPLICLLGYPLWMRQHGQWMIDAGWRWTCRWYAQRFYAQLPELEKMRRTLGRKLGCWLRLFRTCSWCKACVSYADGKLDTGPVGGWYCTECWTRYDKHRQCTRCQEWSARGTFVERATPQGVTSPPSPADQSGELVSQPRQDWLCASCNTEPGQLSSGRAGGASLGGRGSAGSSQSQPQGARRRMIQLYGWTPPQPPGQQATGSRKRPPEDSHEEPPPASRRRRNDDTDTQQSTAALGDVQALPDMLTHQKSKEWRIIEHATGMTFDCKSESILSVDSLRKTKMATALRREAHKRLPREVLKRSQTLGDVLAEIEKLPEEVGADEAEMPPLHGDEHAAWGMMWRSKCQWFFRRSQPLPEDVLRIALQKLVERHPALRTQLCDPYNLFTATQQSLTVLDMWHRHAHRLLSQADAPGSGPRHTYACLPLQRLLAVVGRFLEPAIRWSLWHSWPRVGPATSSASLKVLRRAATMADAEQVLWRNSTPFVPPFQAILVPFGEPGSPDEGAVISLAVTHMVSDGYSVVPLLHDLAHLVASVEAEAVHRAGDATGELPGSCIAALGSLPPVPNSFAALESRIAQTVAGNCVGMGRDSVDGATFSNGITRDSIRNKVWYEVVGIIATLPCEIVMAVRWIARCLSVPDDIVILTVLGISLAWLEDRRCELIAMIVPQRDGPGENDMVGLFADIRHLTICTEGLNFLGVALRLHHVVKERLWTEPGLATQHEVTMVNFEWTDFDERHGFSQHVPFNERGTSSQHPLQVSLDQPSREAWRMRVSFDKMRYPQERRNLFFDYFERSLKSLIEVPLAPVWNDDGSVGGCDPRAPLSGVLDTGGGKAGATPMEVG